MKQPNTVELLGYYGSDEIIACSAWTSTSRNLTEEKKARYPKLINDLWMNGHETPFEKGTVHFLVNTDIATHIHLLKHRMSSLNSESGRYKELKDDKFYIPDDWDNIPASFISDAFGTTIDLHGENWSSILEEYSKFGNELYHKCVEQIAPSLGRKRAKESARYFKAYNMQYEADVMFNMRSFSNFQKLRNSEHAQKEIREVANLMLECVEQIADKPFQHTLEIFKTRLQTKGY